MSDKIARFFEDIKGRKIAFMGIGLSNTGLIKLFRERGAAVTACDRRSLKDLGAAAEELLALGIELRTGADYFKDISRYADIIFRTPGMSYHLKELRDFQAEGGIVTSETEVFFDLCPCPIIAVTGSDGKTTTSTLIAEILKAGGRTVHLGGNIGRALLPEIFGIQPGDCAVVELSSFQLISMRSSPQIAVLTNITPNHLDIHANMEEYVAAKRNIFAHQNAFSRTVLGWDSDAARAFAPEIRGECLFFSVKSPVSRGAWFNRDTGWLVYSDKNTDTEIIRAEDIALPGEHNILNYLAAICATRGIAGAESVKQVAREFKGVEHRIELVREHRGVKWYNDSIATSPTRSVAGLRSFDEKLILLAGGYDKNLSYAPLAPEILRSVKLLILTGPTAGKIESAVRADKGYSEDRLKIIRADNLKDAVKKADSLAQDGDVVLLSPASASFDAYVNFEERGRHFKELVNKL